MGAGNPRIDARFRVRPPTRRARKQAPIRARGLVVGDTVDAVGPTRDDLGHGKILAVMATNDRPSTFRVRWSNGSEGDGWLARDLTLVEAYSAGGAP